MSAIDTTVFNELREATGEDFVRELVQTFLDEAPTLLAALRAAIAPGDAAAFRRAAHSLKSNGNTFGATVLAAQARDLEHESLQGLREGAAARLSVSSNTLLK